MTALVLPGDAPYFEVTRRGQLAQGDIFLAPNALVCGVTGDEAASEGPAIPAAVGEAVTVRLWGQPAFGPSSGAPPVNAVAGWTPIMVLTHDCELDKEFNEHVSQYLRDHPGVSEEDVVAMISPRADLHRHAQVAPLLPCDDAVVPAVRHGGIRQARKIGSVPVPAMPAYGDDAFFVPLNRVTTVGRELLATRTTRWRHSPRRRASSCGSSLRKPWHRGMWHSSVRSKPHWGERVWRCGRSSRGTRRRRWG